MSKYQVHMIADAKQDLLDIYHYVAEHDSIGKADLLFDKLTTLCLSLENFPERGHFLPELQRIAVTNYREVHFKPYRVIYQFANDHVYIHCVLDGRRDLESLILQRLLKSP